MEVRPLSPELEEAACRELNENPARREQDLQHIRDWLSKQPHLRARTVPWTGVGVIPWQLNDRALDVQSSGFWVRDLLQNRLVVPLPDTDDLGRRVLLVRGGLYDPKKLKVDDFVKLNFMFADYFILNDEISVIHGSVSLQDNSKITLAHMAIYTPYNAKRLITIFQDGYPQRPKGMHLLGVNVALVKLFNVFKSFMKEKFQRRTHMHENMETVYHHIPKRILPLEYGGEAGPIENMIVEWKLKLEAHRSWFLEDDKFFCDEKKRPGKSKTHEDLFGLEGSFRQLNFD